VSDPIDIKALDEYLKGGSDISQRYRELGREDVPSELDRRVLDAARAAVASGGGARSRSWLRWSAPVALAASVVLVVTVVIESGVQDDTSFATKTVDEVRQVADQRQMEDQRQVEEHKLLEKSAQSLEQESPTQFAPEPAAIVTRAAPAAAPASPPAAERAKAEWMRKPCATRCRTRCPSLSSCRRSIRKMRSAQPSSRYRPWRDRPRPSRLARKSAARHRQQKRTPPTTA
jgi:hypothetical protein